MRGKFTILASMLAITFSSIQKIYAAPDPNFHIYLGFGQSNMEGNAEIESQDRVVDSRFQMLSTANCSNRKLGQWYDATAPLAHCNGGVSPVDNFGRTLIKKLPSNIRVGVVVVAVGGCDIQLFEKDRYKSYVMPDWMVPTVNNMYNGNPYGRLVDMAKIAQQSGVIKGILLHQGETNNGQQDWPRRVKAIYEGLLSELNLKAEDVPLIVGETVQTEEGGNCGLMNSVIATLPSVIPTSHVVSSKGLKQRGDGYHFTHSAYYTFGERYAEVMYNLLDLSENNGGDDKCWSEALGYKCCSECKAPEYTDNDGDWAVENGDWCGLQEICKSQSNITVCKGAQGYPCCKKECTSYYEDNDGKWSVENDDWCLIDRSIC
ncbi:acetylxylan esterase [Neocallimastix lanati (nom. inval.)]|jgi:lysophospholipase L1-like esterase|nr:acetylxylan esterase [Neocallimastix sp. JGI-2020a]